MRKTEFRIDFLGPIDDRKPDLVTTETGAYKIKARINSIGCYNYGDSVELRSPEEVSKAVDSFKGKPLKLGHKTMNNPLSGTIIGRIGDDLEFDGIYTVGTIFIDNPKGKAAWDIGIRCFSCEYNCEIIAETGNFLGTKFDAKQINIRGLAVALVENPRGGDSLTKIDGMPKRIDGFLEVRGDRVIYKKY